MGCFNSTIATYAATIGIIQYNCIALLPSDKKGGRCKQDVGVSFQRYQQLILKLNCAWDVGSDILSKFTFIPLYFNIGYKMIS